MQKKPEETVYGEIAIAATRLVVSQGYTPTYAWNHAVEGKEKSCPKGAFLGLCENGWVVGIPPGEYLAKDDCKNKNYAVRAAGHLLSLPNRKASVGRLWKFAIELSDDLNKKHNQQMNVVLALNESGLLQQGIDPP